MFVFTSLLRVDLVDRALQRKSPSRSAAFPLRSFTTRSARTGRLRLAAEEDREGMLQALFDDDEDGPAPCKEDPSHHHLELDEDGEPLAARFVYVDEETCIGCRHCAYVARNTFFMEDDYGRARVYNQQGDSDEVVIEAIDTCPVNCIHYVSHEDLISLEVARTGQVINFKERLVRGSSEFGGTSFTATSLNALGVRCNNCPSRGCQECPMFGVGENPVYLRRRREREERRARSGATARDEEAARRDAMIDSIYEEATGGAEAQKQGAAGASLDGGTLGAIFADDFGAAPQPGNAGGAAAEQPGLTRSGAGIASSGGGAAAAAADAAANAAAEAASQAWRTLGVARGASRAEVKRAYYRLAKQFHPDTVGGDARRNPTAAGKFAELTSAYELICEDVLGCAVDEVTGDIIAALERPAGEEGADGDAAEDATALLASEAQKAGWLARFRRRRS